MGVIIERQSDHEVLIPFSSAVGRDAVQEAEDQDEFLIEHSNTGRHAERPGETCTPYITIYSSNLDLQKYKKCIKAIFLAVHIAGTAAKRIGG